MKLNLHARNGMVAVVDDGEPYGRTIHKFAVLEDHRRTDPFWGSHASRADLSGVVVEHVQSVTIHHGRVSQIEPTPDPAASREIVERGGEVNL